MGPLLSGGLFTLSSKIEHKGELLAWGLFAGITIVGYFMAMAVDGRNLESEDGGEHGEHRQGDGEENRDQDTV